MSQCKCWNLLIEELNQNPCGLGYTTVTRNVGIFAVEPLHETSIDEGSHDRRNDNRRYNDIILYNNIRYNIRGIHIICFIKNKKEPGSETIIAGLLKVIAHDYQLLDMFNICLKSDSSYSK